MNKTHINELCDNDISYISGGYGMGLCIGRIGSYTDGDVTAFNPNSLSVEACKRFCCIVNRYTTDRYTFITNNREISELCPRK